MLRVVQRCTGIWEVLRASVSPRARQQGRGRSTSPDALAAISAVASGAASKAAVEQLEPRLCMSWTPITAQSPAVLNPNLELRAAHSTVTVAQAATSVAYGKSGTEVALNVLGADPAGESTLTYTWSETGPAAVTFSKGNGSNVAKSTKALFITAGEYQFTVTIVDASGRSVTSSTAFAVKHKEAAIIIAPAHASVSEGSTQRFAATAYDQFNHRLAAQPTFAWSVTSKGAGGKVHSNGVYVSPTSVTGIDRVVATDSKLSAHVVVDVVAVSSASIVGSQAAAASSYNLAELGTSDWAHWGRDGVYGDVDRSATGDSQISSVSVLGAGDVGAFTDTSRFVTWIGGTPTTNEGDDDGYIFDGSALGAGFSFTVPADKTARTLMLDAGGFASGVQLTAHLSDGSAADTVLSSSGAGKFTNLYTITYHAASAGQTLTISFIKNQNVGGTNGSVDLVAAMLEGGPGVQSKVTPLTIMPLGDSVTAGVGLDADTSDSPNYRLPLYQDLSAAGLAVQFEGANDPTNVDSSAPGYCPLLYDLGQNANNGFEGYTSGDILANLAASTPPEFFPVIPNQGGYWLTGGGGTGRAAQFPNVVTLMVGTNDAIFGVPLGTPTTAGTLEGNVAAILKWFATNRPDTKVVVSTAIPNSNTTLEPEITSYNSWLATEVPTFSNDRFINVYPLFTNSDGSPNTNMLQADGVHPTAEGYAEIGNAWATAIESLEHGG